MTPLHAVNVGINSRLCEGINTYQQMAQIIVLYTKTCMCTSNGPPHPKKQKNKKNKMSCKHCAWGTWLQMEVINENSNPSSQMYSLCKV